MISDISIEALRERLIRSWFETGDFSFYDKHVHPDLMGYGTTPTERIFSRDVMINVVKLGLEQAKGQSKLRTFTPVYKKVLADGKCTIFVDEVVLDFTIGTDPFELNLRVTNVFELIDGVWVLVHFHGSMPHEVQSETDTWHVEKWQKRNAELEAQVAEKTKDLQESLAELKATQEQLILQEKLASLGQLAAGIAHEIKNPMNFVNNFSELSLEYADEMRTALNRLEKGETTEEINDLLGDIEENLKKIHQHGTRADGIVKSMLMHSRGGNGISEPTDLNELIREYVNLSFHGMRAGKMPINVKIDLDLQENLPPVMLNPEDFSRVVLNLCKNAFDAMREKGLKTENSNYSAVLRLQTKKQDNHVTLIIEDNGPGVSDSVKNKLFEPFFTTKKGTEGTGLGLSITRDIIKSHKGEISLESSDNEFTRFTIQLPI